MTSLVERLRATNPWDFPDSAKGICDEQERERQIRRELAEFTAHFGIGIRE